MAIIVMHKPTGERYVLIGTGFGAYKSRSPSFLGGNMFPNEEYGELQMAALSDARGNIVWMPTEQLQVLVVDGNDPAELLATLQSDRNASSGDSNHEEPTVYERCPACDYLVKSNESECPSCGLTLISNES